MWCNHKLDHRLASLVNQTASSPPFLYTDVIRYATYRRAGGPVYEATG